MAKKMMTLLTASEPFCRRWFQSADPVQIPGHFIAAVSGCAQSILSDDQIKDELDYQINLRMKELYREGYRRFRAVPMARTGDPIRRLVMGWPA